MIQGTGTATVTPFRNGQIDKAALKWLIERQVEAGCSFVVPCGTTGESPTLSHEEHVWVIKETVKIVNGRIKVVAGTGSNCTDEAIRLTTAAREAGADAALVVSPYYNKPMPAGLRNHYRQIAKVGLPIILYDIPGRTAKGVPTDVILELAHEGSIAGIKWASGDLAQLMEIIQKKPEGFTVLSGDDNLTFALLALGGNGVISVLGNITPRDINEMVSLALEGKFDQARVAHYALLPLMKTMFIETNPIPVKTALAIMYKDIFTDELRPPMSTMEIQNRVKLAEILKQYDYC